MLQHPLSVGDPAFEPYVITEGKRWRLYLNARDQRYLGRSYIWLTSRHVPNMPMGFLNQLEKEELFTLMEQFRRALTLLDWHPVRINACWLGNEEEIHEGHGHMHLIPRYHLPTQFGGRVFHDPQPKKNYTPHERLRLPDRELFAIRDAIRSKMPNQS